MDKIISKPSLKRNSLYMIFLILFCFIFCENVVTRQHWERDYLNVWYDPDYGCIVMKFEIFDYHFGPANENGFLEYGDFYYSFDGFAYDYLMRAETNDQRHENWTWVNMKNKKTSADLRFYGCYAPDNGSKWQNNINYWVNVYDSGNKAFLTIKWFVPLCLNIKYIRFSGKWHINGAYKDDFFWEYYSVFAAPPLQISPNLKESSFLFNEVSLSENNSVKVFAEEDLLVVKNACYGENIKVYTTSGAQIKSIVADMDEVKIQLPAKQIYIVKIGQAHYKVAL